MYILVLMYLYIKAKALYLVDAATKRQLEPQGCVVAIGRAVTRFAVAGLVIIMMVLLGTLTKTEASDPLPTTSPIPVENLPIVEDIFGTPPPKTLAISVVDSQYQIKQAEEQKKAAELKKAAQAKKRAATPAPVRVGRFSAGYCTAYVASKFPVTWGGNASAWKNAAASQGYKVDRIPEAGAILQTREDSKNCRGCGHVAYIEAVVGDSIYITEQNYKGWGIVSSRVIPINSSLVLAVIHRR